MINLENIEKKAKMQPYDKNIANMKEFSLLLFIVKYSHKKTLIFIKKSKKIFKLQFY